MKSTNCFIFSFLIILVMNNTYAGIITVNNVNPSPGQYSDLQTAIDVANAGDTLLIHRSTTSYGSITLTKRLTLIGEGVLPNKTPNTQTTTLGTLTLTYNPSTLEHASKSSIIGLNITTLRINEKSTDVNFACDSIHISYCRIAGLNPKNNLYGLNVQYSVINLFSGGMLFNCSFKNNFINTISSTTTEGNNNLFLNNILMARLTFNGGIVVNNIFYCPITTAFVQSCKNVIFSNNIFYGTSTTFDPTNYSTNGNTSVNNQFNVDPLFVNPVPFATVNAYTHTSPASGPFADFHLQTGSPAIGAGTDGTDLGIYGSSTPWRDGSTTDSRYRYYPLPDVVPVITGVTVQNPVVNEGGNLQIQLGATTTP